MHIKHKLLPRRFGTRETRDVEVCERLAKGAKLGKLANRCVWTIEPYTRQDRIYKPLKIIAKHQQG
jgi:hypothetical protein